MTLHLDNMYRDRWELYHLSSGSVMDSRQINWREVEWEKVEKITFHLRKNEYVIDQQEKPNFKGFMRFRWVVKEPVYKDKKYIGRKISHIWTMGWMNGATAFLQDYDFKTGDFIKNYSIPLSEIKKHIHPRLEI